MGVQSRSQPSWIGETKADIDPLRGRLFRYSILVLPDEVSETASGLLDEVANDPILTPFLWPSEMANVLLMAERRGRISAAQRDQAFVLLDRLPITVAPFDRVLEWPITYALARRFGLTFYDACYVRLSARLGVPLASLDKQMTDAAKVLGVQLAL